MFVSSGFGTLKIGTRIGIANPGFHVLELSRAGLAVFDVLFHSRFGLARFHRPNVALRIVVD